MKEGTKYVVEVEEIYVAAHANTEPQRLYRIKGFDSLVFTEKELAKLVPYEQYKLEMLSDVIKGVVGKE